MWCWIVVLVVRLVSWLVWFRSSLVLRSVVRGSSFASRFGSWLLLRWIRLVRGLFVRWLATFGGSFGSVVVCLGLVQVLVRFESSSLDSVLVGSVVV